LILHYVLIVNDPLPAVKPFVSRRQGAAAKGQEPRFCFSGFSAVMSNFAVPAACTKLLFDEILVSAVFLNASS
jgi:hypothetical protein